MKLTKAMLSSLDLWVLLMTVSSVFGSLERPSLCTKASLLCECLDESPYLVDCDNFGIKEFPIQSTEEYASPWVARFGSNMITHVPEIPRQDELIELSLRDNPITTIADSAFTDLPQLRSIILSHCRLTRNSLTQDAFRGPYDPADSDDPLHPLELLDLSHNLLDILDNHAFNHLTRLKVLIISDNPFHDFTSDTARAFNELTGLEELDLSRTGLKRIPQQFLAGMKNLKKLVLEGNKFITVPQEVNFAKTLHTLILDNNPIVTISPTQHSAFHGPESLTTLSLSNMPKLETIQRESFNGLHNLSTISINNNPRLRSISKLAFIDTDNIKNVYLQSNRLTTLSTDLLNWGAVEKLDMQHNPWHCDCHILWMTQELLPRMMKDEPELTTYITCAAPLETLGRNIKVLMRDDYYFPCPSGEGLPMNPNYYGPLIVVTIFVGALLLLAATLLCTYVLYQNAKGAGLSTIPVRYRRAEEGDVESITQNIHT